MIISFSMDETIELERSRVVNNISDMRKGQSKLVTKMAKMADYSNDILYFVVIIKLLIPLERGYKSNISFIFNFFDIINNTKVMIKRILYFN